MPLFDDGQNHPSAQKLMEEKVASRIHRKDASLYAFSDEALAGARDYMGWADLAENPPYPLEKIQTFADEVIADGIDRVILIAQGGSIQAPMTMAEYHAPEGNRVSFVALDSITPTGFREALAGTDPARALCIMSSKSGGTIEPNVLMSAAKAEFSKTLAPDRLGWHFVAITDPGSSLEEMAEREHWRAIFFGEPTVGGRFSALSVFGLLPAALIGIDLAQMMASVSRTECLCSRDDAANPAICLASFLYDNQMVGRGKFSLITPKRAATLCLWIEQLVAESTGKDGKGELPNTELDTRLLSADAGDRCAITYRDAADESPQARAFATSLEAIAPTMPRIDVVVANTVDLISHFVIWEYATAMLGWLMGVCPFDQPDVQSTKTKVLALLAGEPVEPGIDDISFCGPVRLHLASLGVATDLPSALKKLFVSIGEHDFFSLNAFLPIGAGRMQELENIRHDIAEATGAVTCLEIGPRYLHSIGQLQKGGPNDGVFLLLSSDDEPDVTVEGQKVSSLSRLAKTQALGDYSILAERHRRALLVNLPDNAVPILTALRQMVREALAARDA